MVSLWKPRLVMGTIRSNGRQPPPAHSLTQLENEGVWRGASENLELKVNWY